jgi:thymidylate synthase (FAD)
MVEIKPHITVVDKINGDEIIKKLNRSARKCYQSQPNGPDENLVRNIIKSGHTSVLEHVSITFDITTSRGVTHELVRHRIASYSQESTRYCKYQNGDMQFVRPIDIEVGSSAYNLWREGCVSSESVYKQMMDEGCLAQQAREVLNNSLKTEIRMTMNIRSLRNFFSLRCDRAAHPNMKEIAIPLMMALRSRIPVVFDDIEYDAEFAEKYNLGDFDSYVTFAGDENISGRKDNLIEFMKSVPERVVENINSIKFLYNQETAKKEYIKYTTSGGYTIIHRLDNSIRDILLTQDFPLTTYAKRLHNAGYSNIQIAIFLEIRVNDVVKMLEIEEEDK